MRKTLAALGLAVAVPVALAAPALAKSPANATPSVSSVLRQHEGFRAEVTYLCTGPKDQEGTIKVLLQQLPKPGANNVDTVATASDEAKCDGQQRDVKIKIPVAAGAVQAGWTVQLYTTLTVVNQPVLTHTSAGEPVADDSQSTPSPSPTGTQTPSASPSSAESEHPETETPSPSASSTESEHPETETPSPSASSTESEHPETEKPETEKPSPSSTPTS
jgi:hypothetical protein